METTRRERNRENTLQEIKSTAWEQIANEGVSALSLRAIARAMGMTAPGLYRYFANRDELVSALIIDAFDSFGRFLEEARDALPAGDHLGRFRAICMAYFEWAKRYPNRYTILFGTPVPGYTMTEAVFPSARRSFLVLQGVIGEAFEDGKIRQQADPVHLDENLLARYALLNQYGMPYTPLVTHLAMMTWSHVHGITSLYLYGYLHGFLGEQIDAFAAQEIDQLAGQLGLE